MRSPQSATTETGYPRQHDLRTRRVLIEATSATIRPPATVLRIARRSVKVRRPRRLGRQAEQLCGVVAGPLQPALQLIADRRRQRLGR
jgi:hypothetical protein